MHQRHFFMKPTKDSNAVRSSTQMKTRGNSPRGDWQNWGHLLGSLIGSRDGLVQEIPKRHPVDSSILRLVKQTRALPLGSQPTDRHPGPLLLAPRTSHYGSPF